MSITFITIFFVIYGLAMCFILLYSFIQANLIYHYRKQARKEPEALPEPLKMWPMVTVQLPIYNELYVVERLIDAVTAFDYPQDRLHIQVLDDSTDETREVVAKKVKQLQIQGVDIVHIHRVDRTGFKAGALQAGLEDCKGDLVAIFDADFVPKPDFLKSTIPYFTDSEIGMVQTRWEHLNRNYSLLTHLQAFGLDAHFTVEQGGRNGAGFLINFNGTAGVWRKQCIDEAGGWCADTLTEDLDLSYRAQLKGWRFKYLENTVSPAELPPVMSALKSQQYRWTKGAAETARKNLPLVWRSSLPFSTKLHAIFHLLNSTLFICIVISAILSVPLLLIKQEYPQFQDFYQYMSIFLVSFIVLSTLYWVSASRTYSKPKGAWLYFVKTFPLFLSVSMGLSLHNAIAVIEGYLGIKTPFIRTPKFNLNNSGQLWSSNKYVKTQLNWLTVLEGLFALYFLSATALGVYIHDWGLIPFHLMLTIGFTMVFAYTLWHSKLPVGQTAVPQTVSA